MATEAQNIIAKFAKANSIDYNEIQERQSFQNIQAGKYRHEFSDGSALICDYRRGCLNLGVHANKLKIRAVQIACALAEVDPKFAMPKLVVGLSEKKHS